MNSKLFSRNGASRRPSRPGRSGAAAALFAAPLAISGLLLISPLCSAPASAQISIGGNGNSGLDAELSVLQSYGAPLYLNLGLGSQSIANFGLTESPSTGDLFGTTATGGVNNDGSVFEITPSGQIQLLHSFGTGAADGITPSGSLTLGPDGNLYGVTQGGGASGDGTMYQITPTGVVTLLHSFAGGADGALPTGSVNVAPDGTVTGTTSAGGAANDGTVYQIAQNPSGAVESVLHSFTGGAGDGSDPVSGVIQTADGTLFGTTTGGGASGDGTVFMIANDAGNDAESIVHSFTGGAGDGSDPVGGLIQTASGALAGTTAGGGANNAGTVYQIADAATQPVESLLGSLSSGTTGSDPVSSLIQMADGSLLGTATSGGASGGGTVFDLLPNGTLSTVESFTGNNSIIGGLLNTIGNSPAAPLVQGAAGTLYGTTDAAGLNGVGTIYKIVLPESVTGVSPTRFDVNADGYADILFYNTIHGGLSFWLMDDQTVEQYGSTFATLDPSLGYVPVGMPDSSGGGHPDILFWNKNTGAMSIWNLSPGSASVSHYGSTFATLSDTNWVPSAIANDKGDGTYQIIFQNSATGDISYWNMNGSTVTQYGSTVASLGPSTPWHLVGAPDIDADGQSDYLFWNSVSGNVSYWTIQDNHVQRFHGSFTQVTDTNWHLVGAPDLNDDGEADLLWENMASGDISRWQMNGSAVTSYGSTFSSVPVSSGWTIMGER